MENDISEAQNSSPLKRRPVYSCTKKIIAFMTTLLSIFSLIGIIGAFSIVKQNLKEEVGI